MNHNNKKGFAAFELILVVLIFGMIAAVSYLVVVDNHKISFSAHLNNPGPGQSSESAVANDVSKAPTISSPNDLSSASKVLDQNDPSVSNNDAKQLSSYSSNF